MRTFAVTLLDGRGSDRAEAVRQFVGADASGSFGLLAGHAHLVAVLRHGLARFEDAEGTWHYVAVPGGTLRFADNRLTLATVRYFLGVERDAILAGMAQEMAQADSDIAASRATLGEIERSLLRRLAELGGGMPEGRAVP